MDIASLSIEINTSDVAKAETDLDRFAQSGANAEQAAGRINSVFNKNAEAMKLAGISAGQYSQAMRLLPMQLTDVVTSLASGMPAWQVFIQ